VVQADPQAGGADRGTRLVHRRRGLGNAQRVQAEGKPVGTDEQEVQGDVQEQRVQPGRVQTETVQAQASAHEALASAHQALADVLRAQANAVRPNVVRRHQRINLNPPTARVRAMRNRQLN